jgi:hypothetical protein
MAAAQSGTGSVWSRMAPAFALLLLAPLIAEALQGATRPSTYLGFPMIFVFEAAVWGGAAVFLRYLARSAGLGWLNLVLLAATIAVAEEFLIQQTSVAPMVIQIRGVEYARAFGVNYVYFVWALAYEMVFVVLVPVLLAELLFPKRRRSGWLSRAGLIVLVIAFVLGALGAWFSWTQIARPNVFHLPKYDPPMTLVFAAVGALAVLFFLAVGPFRRALARPAKPIAPPPPFVVSLLAFLFAALLEALAALAFGAWPQVPPAAALGAAALVFALALVLTPAWAAHANWRDAHRYALMFGAIVGNMGAGYLGYIWNTSPIDLWGKTILDGVALAALIALGFGVARRSP